AARPDQGRSRARRRDRVEAAPGEAAQERLARRRRRCRRPEPDPAGAGSPGGRRYREVPRPGRRRVAKPQTVTRTSASTTMALLILLAPRSRSTKVIGTSVTVSPARMVRRA